MKKTFMLTSLVGIIAFSGCSTDTPKCSDVRVKTKVINTYKKWKDELNNTKNPLFEIFLKGKIPNLLVLKNARAISYNKEIKLRECKAEAIFDNNQTWTIHYTVQNSEENPRDFYVEISKKSLDKVAKESIVESFFQQLP